MPIFLGIDTSNYTTSAALVNTDSMEVFQSKKLLPVKEGELGLRQSDAVFHHTKQLPDRIVELFDGQMMMPSAIGVSVRPRNIEGSYMPCFLCGEGLADSLGSFNGIKVYKTSHQIGHILAAIFSAGRLDLIRERFIAFHVSGGTTDCLFVEPDDDTVFKITEICTSLDLKAGQAIDRVGLMLGMKFPCGKELESLAVNSDKNYKIKSVLKDGNCCLSGLENKCRKMLEENEAAEDIANYCLESICSTISAMTEFAVEKYGKLPIVYAGGVISDRIIRDKLLKRFDAFFAEPEFSCDNAVGTAVYAAIKEKAL